MSVLKTVKEEESLHTKKTSHLESAWGRLFK